MPTILVFLGSLSLFPSLAINNRPLNLIDILACAITLCAIIIETVSDQQLRKFIRKRKNKDEIINIGLWRYSRHPNYFGEILFWWGLYFFALAVDLTFWWIIIGPISIVFLFLVISIPLIEKKISSKPGYKSYQEEVSKLLPWFPKKKSQIN
jgi:steroid 5-alpha reductase family enzyme